MIETSPERLKLMVIQCTVITILLFIVLIFFKIENDNVLIAAVGSSSFTIFAMPNAISARIKNILGGYCIGMIIGVLCSYLKLHLIELPFLINLPMLSQSMLVEFTSAVAIGATIFWMLVLSFEHPPAVGVALGLTVSPWNQMTIVTIMVLVVILLATKYLMRNHLQDLARY